MRECDNSKIHVSNNSLLSVCLFIMLDTLLLVPSLHCNTLRTLETVASCKQLVNWASVSSTVVLRSELESDV